MVFNVLFYFAKTVLLTNYADDNTFLCNCQIIPEKESKKCIWWFAINCMTGNPDKFQAILLKCESDYSHSLYVVNGCSIDPSEEVRLLGMKLDWFLITILMNNVRKQADK